MRKHKQSGFSFLAVLLVMLIIGTIAIVAIIVWKGRANVVDPSGTPASVNWRFDDSQSRWVAQNGTPPTCPQNLIDNSPVDVRLVSAVFYPGQYRGGIYESDGGFRFSHNTQGDVLVRAPATAKLVSASRYLESTDGEVQYSLVFVHPCGIMYRFDHLRTLSPRISALVKNLPQPQVGNSQPHDISKNENFEAREVLATEVGIPSPSNIFIDFGVYDLRNTNDISRNSSWAELHEKDKQLAWFGRCWLIMLPSSDAQVVQSLPPADESSRGISDYCPNSSGTLDFNNGLPPQ